jgi:UDP-glucose 4-epimerase
MLAHDRVIVRYAAFNVATGDAITVREIADLAVECMGLRDVAYEWTGGDRGWKGDVPVVRLDIERIQALGWRCRRSSREALRASMLAMLAELERGAAAGTGEARP